MAGCSYFVSDVHLGLNGDEGGLLETRFCEFLDFIAKDAKTLFLLGDIFDFWVEYKDAIPSGFDNVLKRFKTLVDGGCRVIFFKGNHDYWTLDYFERELGVEIVDSPYGVYDLDGLTFFVGHGDVLGCTSLRAKLIFRLFRNPFLIDVLRKLPRKWILRFGLWWSSKSRKTHGEYSFCLEDSDIRRYAESVGASVHIDHFIFGHFHKESSMKLDCGSQLHILGDWASRASYLKFPGPAEPAAYARNNLVK